MNERGWYVALYRLTGEFWNGQSKRMSGTELRVVRKSVVRWEESGGELENYSGVRSCGIGVNVRILLRGCHVSYIRTVVGRTD